MHEREISCCFSGHRPTKLPWGVNELDARCVALKAELDARLEGIYQSGYRHFICGMALGCDMYFAEAVIKLRQRYADVTLQAAVPCGTQPDRWNKAQRERYNLLLDACNEVSVLQIDYTPECMLLRNQYMVDRAALLLCCYNGFPGGTMKTILYAERNGVNVITIDI